VYGATLCYTKAFWRSNPFPDIHVGEDTRFVWSDRVRHLLALENRPFLIATIHAGNTSPKQTHDCRWRARDVADARAAAGDRWEAYCRAVGGMD
jgi:hypothetical protein